MDLFKPKGASSLRRPTDNSQEHGRIVNVPRYSVMGGLSNASKIGGKNKMTIGKPGDGKKVI